MLCKAGLAWPSSVRDAATIWAFRRECGILVHCLTGLQEPGDGIVIAFDDLHSFMASGNGEIRLVWGDQKRMERIRVYGAASVETAIREAVRSCGRQIA